MNKLDAFSVIGEYARLHGKEAINNILQAKQPKIDLTKDLFPMQVDFINHKSKRKAMLFGRRSGKSYAAAHYLIKTAYENKGCLCSFIGITAGSAKKIIWDIIIEVSTQFDLKIEPNITNMLFSFPNGSKIIIAGADNEREMRKHLGVHNELVIIDECGEFGSHLETFIKKTIMPTLIDTGGTICLLGTPGDLCGGFWFKVTKELIKGWKVWKGNMLDNPKMPIWKDKPNWKKLAKAELERVKLEEGYDDESPQYIRQYLGRWHEGSSSLVYSNFSYENNTYEVLPKDIQHWNHLIGIDYGIEDASSIVVAAYSEHTNNLYIIETYKKPGLTPEEMAYKVKFYYDKYEPVSIVADGNGIGAAFLSQLNSMYALGINLAAKKDKASFIELLNDDFRLKKIKINRNAEPLLTEIATYQWKDSQQKILPAVAEDHCCDALLYLWRESLHYLGRKPRKIPTRHEPGYGKYLVERELEAMEEAKNANEWEELAKSEGYKYGD